MADDAELRESYREWCQERGYSTRRGFADFAEEYIEQHDAVWDSLNDFDDNDWVWKQTAIAPPGWMGAATGRYDSLAT